VDALKSPTEILDLDFRRLGWPIWILLGFAVVAVASLITSPGVTLLGPLQVAMPFFFAAAVLLVRPIDRRFVWAAVAIGASQAFLLGPRLVPAEWTFYYPELDQLGGAVTMLYSPALLGGLALLGLALGGIRTRLGWLIVGIGLVLAASSAVRVLTQTLPEGLELSAIDRLLSIVIPPLHPMAWAFVAGAALGGGRRLFPFGALLIFVLMVPLGTFLLWDVPSLGPDTNFGLLQFVFGIIPLTGWIALTFAPLFGEVDGQVSEPRSPVMLSSTEGTFNS
jgi:hypothetical protein